MEGWYEGDQDRMDGVKVTLGQQRNDCGGCAKDRRALVHMQLNDLLAAVFALSCVLSDRPRLLRWLSRGERWDADGKKCK